MSGPSLSPVQFFSITLLDRIERIDQFNRNDRELRLAMLAGNYGEPEELFEELRTVVADDEAEIEEGTDLQGEAVAVKYDFSHVENAPTQEEVEREVREMLAMASSGEASFEDEPTNEWI